MGGFHFNDKKYGDDDLTVGAINPYQLFLVYCEFVAAALDPETASCAEAASVMIDQNHNIKNQIEGMIQSVIALQTAYAKAFLVDFVALAGFQAAGEIIRAEECLKDAFNTDVRPLLAEVRSDMELAEDPLDAFRQSGYMDRISRERTVRARS